MNMVARSSFFLAIAMISAAIGLLITGISMTGEAMAVNVVSVGDNFFAPQAMTVPVGSAIEWRNNGNLPHTATADSGTWDSSMLKKGQTFSQSFEAPGTFTYICSFHPEMVGTVVVEAPAAPTAPPAPAGDAQPVQQAAPSSSGDLGAGVLPNGGGPPGMDGTMFQGAAGLAAVGALLMVVGFVATVTGTRYKATARKTIDC